MGPTEDFQFHVWFELYCYWKPWPGPHTKDFQIMHWIQHPFLTAEGIGLGWITCPTPEVEVMVLPKKSMNWRERSLQTKVKDF